MMLPYIHTYIYTLINMFTVSADQRGRERKDWKKNGVESGLRADAVLQSFKSIKIDKS